MPDELLGPLRAALADGDVAALRATPPGLRAAAGLDAWVRELEQRLEEADLESLRELVDGAAAGGTA